MASERNRKSPSKKEITNSANFLILTTIVQPSPWTSKVTSCWCGRMPFYKREKTCPAAQAATFLHSSGNFGFASLSTWSQPSAQKYRAGSIFCHPASRAPNNVSWRATETMSSRQGIASDECIIGRFIRKIDARIVNRHVLDDCTDRPFASVQKGQIRGGVHHLLIADMFTSKAGWYTAGRVAVRAVRMPRSTV